MLELMNTNAIGAGYSETSQQSCFTDNRTDRAWAVSVDEKIHGLSAQKFTFICEDSRVINTSLNGFTSDGGKLVHDAFNIHACSQRFQDDMDRGSGSSNAGFPVLDVGINTDILADISHRKSITRDISLSMRSFKVWVEVSRSDNS